MYSGVPHLCFDIYNKSTTATQFLVDIEITDKEGRHKVSKNWREKRVVLPLDSEHIEFDLAEIHESVNSGLLNPDELSVRIHHAGGFKDFPVDDDSIRLVKRDASALIAGVAQS